MRRATSDKVQDQQLKVQELVIRATDTHLFENDGADTIVEIGEDVAAVVACLQLDDSAPGVVMIAAASLSVENDTQIKITGAQLATNDVFVIKYISAN